MQSSNRIAEKRAGRHDHPSFILILLLAILTFHFLCGPTVFGDGEISRREFQGAFDVCGAADWTAPRADARQTCGASASLLTLLSLTSLALVFADVALRTIRSIPHTWSAI